jgi:MFS family permease
MLTCLHVFHQAFIEVTFGVGLMIGPAAGGYLYEHTGLAVTTWIFSVLSAFTTIYAMIIFICRSGVFYFDEACNNVELSCTQIRESLMK